MTVTFFENEFARSLVVKNLTLRQLREIILTKTAASKMGLEWLKLAIFGNKRSEKNCLRTNANVVQITGIETEHDAGEISFDTAIAVMREGPSSLAALHVTVLHASDQGTLAHSGAAVAELSARDAGKVCRAHQWSVRRQDRAGKFHAVAGVSVRSRR